MAKTLGRLCEYEIGFALLALGLGTALPDWVLPALLLMLLFWPLRKIALGRWTVRTPADAGIAFLALLVPLNIWLSPLPDLSAVVGYRLLLGIGFYYALVNWIRNGRRLRGAALSVLPVAGGLAAFALVSVDWTQSKLPFLPAGLYDRILVRVSDSVHPNVLAGSLVLLLAGMAAGLLWGWGRVSLPGYVIFVIVYFGLAFVLVLTQSRAAFLALGAAGLVLVCLRWRWGWLSLLPVAAVLWLVLSSGNSQEILNNLMAGAALDGFDGREEIWGRAVYMIRDFPLTGVGAGLYSDTADQLYPFLPFGREGASHAHNLFLQVAVDFGIPGLVAWLAVFWLAFVAGWRLYRGGGLRGSAWQTALGAGLLAVQAALAVHGLLDAVTWGMVRSAPLVWGLWGMAAAGMHVSGKAGADDEGAP